MGKWTLEHHDDVLYKKLKTLVAGAVRRAALEKEKGEPTISYEMFVEDLDEGDSFTTSLIDVLVKELAERRMRPNPSDRHLISERTAKSLRMQAQLPCIYRGRSNRLSSGRFTASEYLSAPPGDMELSDEDDDLDAFASSSAPEGVRINSELHDAYLSRNWAGSSSEPSPLVNDDGSVIDRELVTSPRPISPPLPVFRNTFWGGAGSSSLTRHSSLRRPTRSRTIDFNDFTLRRRSIVRQSSQQDTDAPRTDEPADGTWSFAQEPDNEASSTRRFYPLSSLSSQTRTRRRLGAGGSDAWRSEPVTERSSSLIVPSQLDAPSSSSSPAPNNQSSSQLWYSFTSNSNDSANSTASPSSNAPTITRRASSTGTSTDRRPGIAPRLRRGGVRAPESIPHHWTSPMSLLMRLSSSDNVNAQDVGTNPTALADSDVGHVHDENTHVGTTAWEQQREDSRQLLTPRSPSPAGEN